MFTFNYSTYISNKVWSTDYTLSSISPGLADVETDWVFM